MSIKSHTIFQGKVAIIELKGALVGDDDIDSFRSAVTDFIEQGNRCLLVNLQKVNYINSAGMGALIGAHTSYVKNGGQIRLVGVTGNVQNLLMVTRLVDVFDVFETVDEAIENFMQTKSTI